MKHPEKSAFSFGAAFNQLNEFRATKMLEWLFTNQQSLAKENCSFQFDCFNVLTPQTLPGKRIKCTGLAVNVVVPL